MRTSSQTARFEQTIAPNQFGHVFKHWGGWKYEGECEFRVGQVAHSGKTSCLLFGASLPKIRITQTVKTWPPGRYKADGLSARIRISARASITTRRKWPSMENTCR